jgi:glucosamine-6-phosphate isomerase
VFDLIQLKPGAVICFASGETPRLTCRLLVEKLKDAKTDLTNCTFIGLDEWVGIAPGNEGSCHYFFMNELIKPLGLSLNQFHLFNALSSDLDAECKKMDATISAKGGIDVIVVGIGMNGHIGFNEPGVSFENLSHVIHLDETTRTVGQKYFRSAQELQKGITLGLKHLLEAKKAILVANGKTKAGVIRHTVHDTAGPAFPATVMQTHHNGYIMIDREAASLLDQNNQP